MSSTAVLTIVGVGVALFGAYLTIAYVTQRGKAKVGGVVNLQLPIGVIVLLAGIGLIAFPYTALYTNEDASTPVVAAGPSTVSTPLPTVGPSSTTSSPTTVTTNRLSAFEMTYPQDGDRVPMCLQAKGSGTLNGGEALWIAAYYPQPTGEPKEYFLQQKASFNGNRWIADYVHVGGEGDNSRTMGVVAFVVKDAALSRAYDQKLKSEKTAIGRLPSDSHPVPARVTRTASPGCG